MKLEEDLSLNGRIFGTALADRYQKHGLGTATDKERLLCPLAEDILAGSGLASSIISESPWRRSMASVRV